MKQEFSGRDFGALPWGSPLTSPYWRIACLPPELWDAPKRAATYNLQYHPLLGGQTLVQSFSVKGSAPFIIYGFTAFALNPGAVPPTLRWGSGLTSGFPSRALIQITDTSRLYNFFSAPAPLDNVANGAGSQSTFLPYVCEPGTSISAMLQSQNVPGASEDWNWDLTFIGAEVLA